MAKKEEQPRFDEATIKNAENIIVTTCDINRPYEIVGPVYVQFSNVGWTSSLDKLEKEYQQRLENSGTEGWVSGKFIDLR